MPDHIVKGRKAAVLGVSSTTHSIENCSALLKVIGLVCLLYVLLSLLTPGDLFVWIA